MGWNRQDLRCIEEKILASKVNGKTGERVVAGLAGDTVLLEKLHLAYRQALS